MRSEDAPDALERAAECDVCAWSAQYRTHTPTTSLNFCSIFEERVYFEKRGSSTTIPRGTQADRHSGFNKIFNVEETTATAAVSPSQRQRGSRLLLEKYGLQFQVLAKGIAEVPSECDVATSSPTYCVSPFCICTCMLWNTELLQEM